MADTDPRSADMLAKALYARIAHGAGWGLSWGALASSVQRNWREALADFLAHPAMLARDAALRAEGSQQGRDDVAAAVETAADGLAAREATWHDLAKHDAYAEGARDAFDIAEQVVRAALPYRVAADVDEPTPGGRP